MSPLASVIRSTRVQAYLKVDNDTPFALFHQKFWGKSMEDEKAKWQETQIGGQPEDTDQPEDEDQNKHEAMDKGKGKAMDEGGDEVMNEDGDEVMNEDGDEVMNGNLKPDEDEGEATDEEDDILPDCYVLDISIEDMPTSLWIRADYIRIFNCFQAHYDEYTKPKPKGKTPSAVLTGQPGTGKSFWIYYAARRLLAEKSPFIWFYQSDYYLFVDDGAYSLPPDWKHTDFRSIIWTLVDADHSTGVPETVFPPGTRLFVTYVTSPAVTRWSRLDKTTRMIVVVMNPWGRKEIQRAACLSPLEGITKKHVNEIFDELGPVARLCVEKVRNELARYRIELHEAITKITADNIKKLTNEASGLTMDAVSHKICLLSRQKRHGVHSRTTVAPITDSIKSRLSNQFRKLERAEQVRLYQFFEKVPESRKVAGIFYEALAQIRLQDGMSLELFPMVKLQKEEGSKKWLQWYSTHMPLDNPQLEAARRQVLGQQFSVKIQPKEIFEYTENGLQSIKPGVFYVPAFTNQKAFNSFIMLNKFLYIFQMTITSCHDINQGLIAVAEKYKFPPRKQWRFVFIIPRDLILSVPQPWKLDQRTLSPFSAVVCVENIKVSTKEGQSDMDRAGKVEASTKKRKSTVDRADEAEASTASTQRRKSQRLQAKK